jgi:hypothetical protein
MKDKKRLFPFHQGNGFPLRRVKVLPNTPCPCGSGKKVKHCCGVSRFNGYFYSKLTEKQKAEIELHRMALEKQKAKEIEAARETLETAKA